MPSQLYTNDNVSFICARNFTYNGKDYKRGDDFPEEDLVTNVETLVRNRFLIPVVEDMSDKPRHWYRDIVTREFALKKLGIEKPEEAFDPSEHTVLEVVAYLESDISLEEHERVLQAERDGKARKGILTDTDEDEPDE